MKLSRRAAVVPVLCLALLAGSAATAVPAAAQPATPVSYPSGASATRVAGLGFDTCDAPPTAALAAWRASPYRTVNIYFGGRNRFCREQSHLTPSWVTAVTRQGWRLLPTYFGWQPSCITGKKPYRYTAADAARRGVEDARDALAQARALGLRPGSALYADVEHYTATAACTLAVRRYVTAWTRQLHAAGYLAGVYAAQESGARDLSLSYTSTSFARPDALWFARWDLSPSLRGWRHVPDTRWAVHQRAKQYRGDHDETWRGVRLNIDSNALDAPVATVAYGYRVTSSTPLNARRAPSSTAPVVRRLAPGSTAQVLCQGTGSRVGTSAVWDRLTDGSWVSDRYLSTPSSTTFSAPLPRCTYPGQVTASDGLTARTGPGTSYAASGPRLPNGALAWVACQRAGSRVGTTAVWNRLDDGRWVSDYYVANSSNTTYTPAVPRC